MKSLHREPQIPPHPLRVPLKPTNAHHVERKPKPSSHPLEVPLPESPRPESAEPKK